VVGSERRTCSGTEPNGPSRATAPQIRRSILDFVRVTNHCIVLYVVAPRSEDPKLIIRIITFELVQPICPRYINIADGRTEGRTTYNSNTALARASRSKNLSVYKTL